MKSFKKLSQETNRELAINVQKVIHTDTGGQGHHLALARKLLSTYKMARKRGTEAEAVMAVSGVLVETEEKRMEGIRGGIWPRLEILKTR